MPRSRPASNPVSYHKHTGQHFVTRAGKRIYLGSDRDQALRRYHETGLGVEVTDWSHIKGQCRSRFVRERLLCASKPGAQMALDFAGTAIGAYVLAGPDAGIVEASIDGGPYRPFNLFHHYSTGLQYPRTVVFDADLKPGEHRLRLQISTDKGERSTDHAMRVLHFVAN